MSSYNEILNKNKRFPDNSITIVSSTSKNLSNTTKSTSFTMSPVPIGKCTLLSKSINSRINKNIRYEENEDNVDKVNISTINSEDRDEIQMSSIKDQELVKQIKNSFKSLKNNFYKKPFFKKKENSINFMLDIYNETSMKSNLNNNKKEDKEIPLFNINSGRPDQHYLSVLQMKYLDRNSEKENKNSINLNLFEECVEIIDNEESVRNKSNNLLSIEKNRIFLDYFKYKYENYKKDDFVDNKIKNIIINDGINPRSKSQGVLNQTIKLDNIRNFIHRYIENNFRHILYFHKKEDGKADNLKKLIVWMNENYL